MLKWQNLEHKIEFFLNEKDLTCTCASFIIHKIYCEITFKEQTEPKFNLVDPLEIKI